MDTPKRRRVDTRHTFAILVALAAGEQTGSEIQSRIIGDTIGVYVRVSTLYAALHRLEDMGLVESRAKQYRLTESGWHTLKVEAHILESLLEQAKRRVVSEGQGRW